MDIGIGLGEEPGPSNGRDTKSEEEYHYEVLSTEQIVQHMVESIKEVNSVIQVSFLFSGQMRWTLGPASLVDKAVAS